MCSYGEVSNTRFISPTVVPPQFYFFTTIQKFKKLYVCIVRKEEENIDEEFNGNGKLMTKPDHV